MVEFLPALIGGILIGGSAGAYMLFNGRIMGVSGIVGALISLTTPGDWKERIFFVIGMLLAPAIYGLFTTLPSVEITSNIAIIVIGGLLVGFGSRLGSGCTSGHGVCGLGRFSKRSFVAVFTFMIAAILTVFIQNHIFG